jgi:hypothetical protein
MRRNLLFVPSGGLGNRMRAVASAYQLHKSTGIRIRVLWSRDWALNAPFSSIFEPFCEDGFSIEDARRWHYLVYDRPRKHNLFIPRLFQSLLFGQRIDEVEVTPRKQQNFDFEQWASSGSKRKYMSCYQEFGPINNEVYAHLFTPCQAVRESVDRICQQFSSYTYGVHIRRTDNAESIKKSPLYLFFEVIDQLSIEHPNSRFFLATDDETVKKSIVTRYGLKIIYLNHEADRSSINGIKDALTEMYALSRCQMIFGSANSSFSVIASRWGRIPLKIVSGECMMKK